MFKLTTTAMLLSAAVAAPALAQDAPAGPTFAGAHVEALGGLDRVQGQERRDSGALYGIGAGYDVQSGNALFGIEGEASDSTQKKELGAVTEKASRDLYVGGRIGYVVGGNNLLYAKAGYTNARFIVDGTATGLTLANGNLNGARVGAGIEHALSNRAFIKAEYRYSNYEQGVSRNQLVAGVGLHF